MFPCCLTQVKALLSVLTLVSAFFVVNGCVLLDYSSRGTPEEIQDSLEKLVAGQDYHKALIYLDKMVPGRAGEYYKSQQQRITILADYLEANAEKKAVGLAGLDNLREAITIVDQALKKIPKSVKLTKLGDNLRQERDKRLAANERDKLLNEAGYLLAQMKNYGEQAKVVKPSIKTRWKIYKVENKLVALHPDLVSCGQQAIRLGKYDIAKKCLKTSQKIKDSATIKKLLAQVNAEVSEDVVIDKQEPLVVIEATKKSKPASFLAASFLKLEEKLKQELDSGELSKAYDSLAKLEEFPGKREYLNNYRKTLDAFRASRIAKQLEEGADLYRRGKISEARSMWQKILVLDPENQIAKEKIVRADKVLKSVEDLQKAQKQPVSR